MALISEEGFSHSPQRMLRLITHTGRWSDSKLLRSKHRAGILSKQGESMCVESVCQAAALLRAQRKEEPLRGHRVDEP